ncbi:MAG TPA: ABC transporter ATP-binding protein, partial [Burkholderiaceae bacterium]|nr:ABC transporter ATP-binding protein [Burkholderiaceae bacterium]
LLRQLADVRMSLRLRGPLPALLQQQLVEIRDERAVLRLGEPADVEAVLAACREAGVAIDEIEVGMPDLEDVFLQLMNAGTERSVA